MTTYAASATTSTATRTTPLIGRRREQLAIHELLQAARDSAGGVLVLDGEPGVGKTALLESTAQSASGFRIVSAVGVEGEMELPYAALQQLCAPILTFADRLPDLQSEALSVAFGLSAGPAPDAFLVGLAALGLLSEAAEERPLLCLIDDAQWLDSSSAKSLTFAARRVFAEKISVLFAARQLDARLAALPTVHLGPLGNAEARELLRTVLPGPLDARVLERLVAETRGNPLALIEFPRGLTLPQLAGGFALPTALPLTVQIEESFTRRLAGLPAHARRLLLLASADPTGDAALLSRAAQLIGIPQMTGQLLEAQGLLETTSGIAFRHPLVRSAVYREANTDERQEMHRVLAQAIDPQRDPDRRAWHMAQAALGPDEDVAVELERSAARAQSRGGLAASAAFLQRAASLSLDPVHRTERALAAAKAKYEAGAPQDALDLIATVEEHEADDRQRTLLQLLKAQVTLATRRGGEASPMLLDAARALEPINPQLARETYLETLNSALFGGSLAGTPSLVEIGEAALVVPAAETIGATDLLLEGLALWFTDSYSAGVPVLQDALRAFMDDSASQPLAALRLSMASWAAAELWEEETWIRLTGEQLRRARASGELTAVPSALGNRSIIFAMSGELEVAASLVDEQETIRDAAGMAPTANAALWLPAWAGHETELKALGHAVLTDATERSEGYALGVVGLVSAILYNGLGRHEEAMSAVRTAPENARQLFAPIAAVVELIEAASRCGERSLAERALELVLERTDAAQTTWARGTAARSRALLAEPNDEDGLYDEAIERFGETRLRVDLGRTHLLYGESLRRRQRRVDACQQLRKAHEIFAGLGIVAFAERARRELHAAGGRGSGASPSDEPLTLELTPQEARIADLTADGQANREIAAQLFISASTVEYHLAKVFRKLQVKSRTELAQKLHQQVPAHRPSSTARHES
ncbi:MAG TPA: LuxR C-terminal-related transcriptional regulator [Solirubrobacteraceae bacterium]|jgi:DNA-binding CsgD family transcriptional regulator|nr:LuxR C-terminal-related transcriptional regulator [Solirubrobacteraceae bacterium]